MPADGKSSHQRLGRLLLSKGRDDFTAFCALIKAEGVAPEIIGFLAQQAAEKLLKAVLAGRGVVFRKTHDIEHLYQLCIDNRLSLPISLDDLDILDPYVVEFRYDYMDEAEEMPPDWSMVKQSIDNLLAWAETRLSD